MGWKTKVAGLAVLGALGYGAYTDRTRIVLLLDDMLREWQVT